MILALVITVANSEGTNSNVYQADPTDLIAQEQRLALQIITTDAGNVESDSPHMSDTSKNKDYRSPSDQVGAVKSISFDNQYNMIESQLDRLTPDRGHQDQEQRTNTPKRIVINLNSLIANQTGNSNEMGPTKLTIGFAPQWPQLEGSNDGSQNEGTSKSKRSNERSKTSIKQTGVESTESTRPMRDAILKAVHRQGGVPAMVMKDLGQESIERLEGKDRETPVIKIMLKSGLGEDRNYQVDRQSLSKQIYPSESNQRQASSLDNVESVSGELDQVIDELEGQSMKFGLHKEFGSQRQSRQLKDEQGRQLENVGQNSRSLLENKLASTIMREGNEFESISNDRASDKSNDKRLSADSVVLSSGSTNSKFNRNSKGGQDSKQSQFGFIRQQIDGLSSEKTDLLNDNRAKAHRWRQRGSYLQTPLGNSNSFDERMAAANRDHDSHRNELEAAFDNDKNDIRQYDNNNDDDNDDSRTFEKGDNNSNDAKLLSNDVSASLAKHGLDSVSPKSKESDKPLQSGNSKTMDEKVARLLEHLKLYTTKSQLIKAARDLENDGEKFKSPTKNRVNDDQRMSQGQKVTRSVDKKTTSSGDKAGVAYKPQAAESDGEVQARNKIPAPVRYDLIDSILDPTNSVDEGDSLVPIASDKMESRRNGRSGRLNGHDVLHKFQLRKLGMQSMQEPEAEEVDDTSELDVQGSNEVGNNSDKQYEETRLAEPEASEFSEYTGTGDLVGAMKASERRYNDDTDSTEVESSSRRHANDDEQAVYGHNPSADVEYVNNMTGGNNLDENDKEMDEIRALEQVIDELVTREKQQKHNQNGGPYQD